MFKKLLTEVYHHKFVYLLLGLILALGLFLRVYNIDNLLGFYYDQGRDALAVWDLWHFVHFPFIGPTTGIAGIFRGPFYYYLITPAYWLGRGNPIWPSVFLSITTVAASALMYYVGLKIHSRAAGLLAAFISSASFNIVAASRWLSNPTPMLLLSVLLVWMMLLICEGKKWAWAPAVFIAFLSLFNFGSAGEVFYFPALAILFFWQRKSWPSRKVTLITFGLIALVLLPLVAFDIKNGGMLTKNIKNFLVGEKSFALPTGKFIADKFTFYYNVFTSKIFNGRYALEKSFLVVIGLSFLYFLPKLFKKDGVKVLVLLLLCPIIGLTFFQGNFGNIYDYYLTGYYLPFILLFAIILGELWKYRYFGFPFVIYFLYIFTLNNYGVLRFKYADTSKSPGSINFINQKEAIAWIYQNAGSEKFNVDVYVPPVISYAYDYLFIWQANPNLKKDNVPLLYTLYEMDGGHPERLNSWLARQAGIGKVEDQFRTGGIVVERRTRITK